MRASALLVLLTAACGSVTPAGDDDDADAAPAADAAAPAPDAPGPRCSPTAPFGPPVPLTALNATPGSEDSPFLTPDELTIYFSSIRDDGLGDWDVYVATRESLADDFGDPELVPGPLNTSAMQRRPVVSADGLYLYADAFDGDYEVAVASRGSTSESFSALVPVTELDIGMNDGDPYVLPDHGAVYFASDATGSGDLYRAARTEEGLEPPERVVGFMLGDGDLETSPVVTPDELSLYFQSARTGGQGGFDVWSARRSSTGIGFEQPVNLAAINTGANEAPHWISADDCVLYFTRNVSAAGTDYDMFYAVRGQE
jgi:Tol biopolymer transport system component